MCRILEFSRKTFARSFSLYQMQNQTSFSVTILSTVDHEITSERLIILSYIRFKLFSILSFTRLVSLFYVQTNIYIQSQQNAVCYTMAFYFLYIKLFQEEVYQSYNNQKIVPWQAFIQALLSTGVFAKDSVSLLFTQLNISMRCSQEHQRKHF